MEKTKWDVAEGIDYVNGKRVPADRVVELTDDEARFDRDHGRITPHAAKRARAKDVAATDVASAPYGA